MTEREAMDRTAAAQFQRLHDAMAAFGVEFARSIGIFWLLDRLSAWLRRD